MSVLFLNFKCLCANHSPCLSPTIPHPQVLLVLEEKVPLAGDLNKEQQREAYSGGMGTSYCRDRRLKNMFFEKCPRQLGVGVGILAG